MANEKALRTRCFVIMPFSETSKEHTEEYWTKHFETFLKPLIEECEGLEAIRSEPLRGDVLKQIITELVTVPVVVADLTDLNPNVFWELGVRQSFKHGTVTIAEKGTKLPFDISVKGTQFYYPKDYIKTAKFREKIKKAIRHCLSHPGSPDSHVLETISGRGTLYEIIRRGETIRRVEALISERKHNSMVHTSIYNIIKETPKVAIPTVRFRSFTVELLVTTRYLDEDSSFYTAAESYLDWLQTMNEQLVLWQQFRQSTIEWFSRKGTKSNSKRSFNDYKEKLGAAQKKLIALC